MRALSASSAPVRPVIAAQIARNASASHASCGCCAAHNEKLEDDIDNVNELLGDSIDNSGCATWGCHSLESKSDVIRNRRPAVEKRADGGPGEWGSVGTTRRTIVKRD